MNQHLKWIIIGFTVLFALFLASEWWQSYPRISIPPPFEPKSRIQKLDSILIETINRNLLSGLSIGIIEDSKITYIGAFGYQNLDNKDSLTHASPLHVASLSKPFIALFLADYLEIRSLSPKNQISDLTPELFKDLPDLGELTFIQLLSHQSGLRDPSFFAGLFGRKSPDSLKEYVEKFIKRNPKSNSGKSYHYADINYELLGYILEKDSNTPFHTLINTWLYENLGMKNTYFLAEVDSEIELSKSYRKTRIWRRLKKDQFKYRLLPYPSSGMVSTMNDLLKATVHLVRDDLGILASSLRNLELANSHKWAGFQQISVNGPTPWLGHFGGQGGYSSLLILDPKREFGLVILSNTKDRSNFRISLASQLLQILDP